MKKAVIQTGSKQYIVSVGEMVDIELLDTSDSSVTMQALLVADGTTVQVGAPFVEGVVVTAEVVTEDFKSDKVRGVRFKAKKRVHVVHNHRQHHTRLKIISIA